MKYAISLLFLLHIACSAVAVDYHVGPDEEMTMIADVPWATLQAGDRVYIHWKETPYFEKWVINRQGTEDEPIEIIGISGPLGQQPVISGDGAVTPADLNYWNDSRGVIKIGGSSIPEDGLPNHISIENLEIRSAHPDYEFTDDNGNVDTYSDNAAAIYVEKAANLSIINCTLHDSGNGLFIGSFDGQTEHILIESNYIYGNGIVGEFLEHNTYTEATDIVYQYNRFGPLRDGADGNNLKDRSAGLVVRYNWIEGGNRQLDLVDAGSETLINHPSYVETHVYGNVLIEPEGAGNSQIVHYGGDSNTPDNFRKGTMFFYHNTVISTREGNTTLVRLSSAEESAWVFNNIIYTTASGNHLAMINGDGTFDMNNNWLKSDWVECHCTPTGIVNDLGGNITGTDPGFELFDDQEFGLVEGSEAINQGVAIPDDLLPEHDIAKEYVKHQDSVDRTIVDDPDIGAFELEGSPTSVAHDLIVEPVLYPNPAANRIFLSIPLTNSDYLILDASGKCVQSAKQISARTIDVSRLAPGYYFVRFELESEVRVSTFVKQ